MEKKDGEAKIRLEIQSGGLGITEELLVARAKEAWKNTGHLVSVIEKLDLYVKPEENRAYYVVNQTTTGSLLLFS
ncbi:MAG: hypothetical protein IJV14_05725 [Lachnospiraceae bacterium]|nr:hypothetical protein [Lachnospiraceae bacterium]